MFNGAIHVKKEIEFVGNKHAFRQLRNDHRSLNSSLVLVLLPFTESLREIVARSKKSGFTNRIFAQHVKRRRAFHKKPAYEYFQLHSELS